MQRSAVMTKCPVFTPPCEHDRKEIQQDEIKDLRNEIGDLQNRVRGLEKRLAWSHQGVAHLLTRLNLKLEEDVVYYELSEKEPDDDQVFD
jgi:hypothetical protein